MSNRLFGCVEAGGTKFLCALADDRGLIGDRLRIPTTTPDETIGAVIRFFEEAQRHDGPLSAIGIASFGPIDRDTASPGWGAILNTPKPGWSGAPFASRIRDRFGVPVGFDTDVNGAAMAEAALGGLSGVTVYITVGTGIGGGVVVDGAPIDGVRHAEMGHLYAPRHPADDFAGHCPYHADCLEGMASGPAVLARWGHSLSELPQDHPAHDIVAHYLAHLCVALMATLSPHRIAFGGGVIDTPGLIDRVRAHARRYNADYLLPNDRFDGIIAPSSLDGEAGLHGALMLAKRALRA